MENTIKQALDEIATEETLNTAKLFALSKMDQKNLTAFTEFWPTIPVARRRAIIQEMLEITEINFEVDFDPVFLTALADQDPEVRARAVNGLWEYEESTLIGPLIHLLKTDDATVVREAAATALGKFIYLMELEEINWNEATLAQEALLEIIYSSDEDINVQRRAVESIAYSSAPSVGPIIESAYYNEHVKMQVSAVFAMGRNADRRWLPRIIAELDNPNSEIRFEAARACGELEANDAVEALIRLIDEDPDIETQEMAIWALGRIGGQTARQALEACLDHENEALVLAAGDSLDELNLFNNDMMIYELDGEDPGDDDDLEELLGLHQRTNGNDSSEEYLH